MPHKKCLVIVFDAPIKKSDGAKSFELDQKKNRML